jgi:hypothetical protein
VLIPDVRVDYSPEDYQAIGGFLLYYRAGILQALRSVSDDVTKAIPGWRAKQIRYYRDAEAVTRWLLSYTPYPVDPYELWDGKTYIPRPRLGDPRSLP